MNQDLIDAFRYARQTGADRASYALKLAREDVAAGRKRYPRSGKPYAGNWQPLDSMARHASPSDRAYYCDEWPDGWRVEGSAYDVCRAEGSRRVEHKGWYTREDGWDGGTLQGYVLQLPARKGVLQYVPGTRHSEWDGVTLYPLDRYDDKLECAGAADRYAEIAAECEREYSAAWDAGQRAADLNERQAELRREVMQVCRDLRKHRRNAGELVDTSVFRSLCGIIRDKVQTLLDDMREARKERDKLRDDVPASLIDAFNEGYGR